MKRPINLLFLLFINGVFATISAQDGPIGKRDNPATRWRFGLGYAFYGTKNEGFAYTPDGFSGPAYLFSQPDFSITVGHTPFRKMSRLELQLQARSLRQRFDSGVASIEGIAFREVHRIDNLYLYPGLGIKFAADKRVEFVLCSGASVVLPLRFYRSIEYLDRQRVPASFPVFQQIENVQKISVGIYSSLSLYLNINNRFTLGVSGRIERLKQLRNYRDNFIVGSPYFSPYYTHLAPAKRAFLQFHTAYKWP